MGIKLDCPNDIRVYLRSPKMHVRPLVSVDDIVDEVVLFALSIGWHSPYDAAFEFCQFTR